MAGESSSLRLARVRAACLLAKIIPVPGRGRRLGISGVKFYRRALEDQRCHIPNTPRPAKQRSQPTPTAAMVAGAAPPEPWRQCGTTGPKTIRHSWSKGNQQVTSRQTAKGSGYHAASRKAASAVFPVCLQALALP